MYYYKEVIAIKGRTRGDFALSAGAEAERIR
jgi:hypothetical protein